MAFISADRVKETTTTTGTGAITLAGASAGFRSFASVMSAADTCHYCIVGNNEWEVGLGTYNTTLARTTVLASSNSNNAVNFSAGTKDIFITIAGLAISELTGGTTGQVLKKTSNADFAFEWAADSTSVAWGAITGTLSAQTDLQMALDAKLAISDADERAVDAVGAAIVPGVGIASTYDDATGTITISATGTQAAISGLISGGQVVWETGYQFRVSAAEYAIDGVVYTSVEQTVTLDAADGTNDRIDVIYLDTAGLAGDITGTAAALPTEPDIDAGTQLKLTFVQVPAASSGPSGVTNTSIYLENTEWTASTSGSGFNANSTNNPYAGTKCIEGTSVANNAYVSLQAGSPLTLDGQAALAMFIRSKAAWNSGRVLRAQWYLNGVAKGIPVTIASGYWGFNSSTTGAYQLVAIPIPQFVVPAGTEVNQLRITDSGGSIGFYIDNIVLQSQGAALGQNGATYLTQAQGDARYYGLADAASTAALQELARDALGTALTAGTGITITPNDGADTITIATTITQYTDELARDAIGTALTDTGLVVVTPNDGGDTIDINVPAAAGSDFRTGTDATKALTSDAVWDAAAFVTLNDSGGNIAVDLATGINFEMTMDGDYTLSNPTNAKPGQTGVIVLTQDGSGTQTLAYGSNWKFAGGTDPVLSTAAGSVDMLFYQVHTSSFIFGNLVKAVA